MMRRIIPSLILLVLFASPSLASDCPRFQAEFEVAKAAHEQAHAEFEAARLAYDQAQASVQSARIKRDELRLAFQTTLFNWKASSSQRVQARANWQRAVEDFRTRLDDLRWSMDTLDMAKAMREQANVDFESARLSYEQADSCHPLYWVKLASEGLVNEASTMTVAEVAIVVLYLAEGVIQLACLF